MSHPSSLSTPTVKRSQKSTFTLWPSQIAPHECCKGAGGDYRSPTSAVLESSASVLLVVSAVWGGRTPIPSQLPGAICRQMLVFAWGKREKRQPHWCWMCIFKCFSQVSSGVRKKQSRKWEKVILRGGDHFAKASTERAGLISNGAGFPGRRSLCLDIGKS